jgi:hypothetical protein
MVGNIRLHMRRDATTCLSLADEFYDPRLGARPLAAASEAIRDELIDYYLGVDEPITEGLEAADFAADVYAGEITVTRVNPVS